jgi:hypothetical protein
MKAKRFALFQKKEGKASKSASTGKEQHNGKATTYADGPLVLDNLACPLPGSLNRDSLLELPPVWGGPSKFPRVLPLLHERACLPVEEVQCLACQANEIMKILTKRPDLALHVFTNFSIPLRTNSFPSHATCNFACHFSFSSFALAHIHHKKQEKVLTINPCQADAMARPDLEARKGAKLDLHSDLQKRTSVRRGS